jgi:hypothetical protein
MTLAAGLPTIFQDVRTFAAGGLASFRLGPLRITEGGRYA